jgi:hypothetical protein
MNDKEKNFDKYIQEKQLAKRVALKMRSASLYDVFGENVYTNVDKDVKQYFEKVEKLLSLFIKKEDLEHDIQYGKFIDEDIKVSLSILDNIRKSREQIAALRKELNI